MIETTDEDDKDEFKFDEADNSDDRIKESDKIDVYDEANIIFVPPMFIIHMASFKSLTLKLNLESFLTHSVDGCRSQLSLLNRQFNKAIFLRNIKYLLLERKLALSSVSKVFMKINSVYKQASIERSSIRKKTVSEVTAFKRETLSSEQLNAIDSLIISQQRLGRLRANTSFHANSLNSFLTEVAPSNRVLSGEAIIFQNETHEIFRNLINQSEFPVEVPRTGSQLDSVE